MDRQPILVLGGHRLIINSNEHFGGMGFYNALKAPKHKIVNHGPCWKRLRFPNDLGSCAVSPRWPVTLACPWSSEATGHQPSSDLALQILWRNHHCQIQTALCSWGQCRAPPNNQSTTALQLHRGGAKNFQHSKWSCWAGKVKNVFRFNFILVAVLGFYVVFWARVLSGHLFSRSASVDAADRRNRLVGGLSSSPSGTSSLSAPRLMQSGLNSLLCCSKRAVMASEKSGCLTVQNWIRDSLTTKTPFPHGTVTS